MVSVSEYILGDAGIVFEIPRILVMITALILCMKYVYMHSYACIFIEGD